MSGAHAQHRVGNRPLIIRDIAIPKIDNRGQLVMRWVSKPGGTYVNGRCVEWEHHQEFVTQHVLDYRPEPAWPGKHVRGRTKPLNAAARAKRDQVARRQAQASKTLSEDRRAMIEHLAG